MQCPNHERDATVDENMRVCPQCGMELKLFAANGPNKGDTPNTQSLCNRRTLRLANTSLILAIFSCPLFLLIASYFLWPLTARFLPYLAHPFLIMLALSLCISPVAIVTGHIAIARGWRIPGKKRIPRRALFGTLIGYLNILVPVALIALAYFGKGRPNRDMAVCGNNLKQLQMMLQKYTNENRGIFPALSPQPGVLMFSTEGIPLGNDIGPLPLTCPTIRYTQKGTAAHQAAKMKVPPIDDQSYFYLGYAVLSDEDVEAFAQAYRKQIAKGGTFDNDLLVGDDKETYVLHRLSQNVTEVLSAAQDHHWVSPNEGHESGYNEPCTVTTDIPVLIERNLGGHIYTDWDSPKPRGAKVLFLHAGVQFVERGTWPITEKTQRILAELAEQPLRSE